MSTRQYENGKYDRIWINYYGPELLGLQSVSLYKALANNDPDVPPGFFSNKVIFVGERLETKPWDTRKDEYPNPFSYLPGNKFFSGVGIHATAFLNLSGTIGCGVCPPRLERTLIISFGAYFRSGPDLLPPVTATLVALLAAIPIAWANYYLFIHYHYWFPGLFLSPHRFPLRLFGRWHSTPSSFMWKSKRWNNRSPSISRPGW